MMVSSMTTAAACTLYLCIYFVGFSTYIYFLNTYILMYISYIYISIYHQYISYKYICVLFCFVVFPPFLDRILTVSANCLISSCTVEVQLHSVTSLVNARDKTAFIISIAVLISEWLCRNVGASHMSFDDGSTQQHPDRCPYKAKVGSFGADCCRENRLLLFLLASSLPWPAALC